MEKFERVLRKLLYLVIVIALVYSLDYAWAEIVGHLYHRLVAQPPTTPAVVPPVSLSAVPAWQIPLRPSAADIRVGMLERGFVRNSADDRWYPYVVFKSSGCTIKGPRWNATITNCKHPVYLVNGVPDPE